MKKEMVEIQQTAVQNQTAVMIEIGTNLLNQTAEQTRKLTDVEAQVSNEWEVNHYNQQLHPAVNYYTISKHQLGTGMLLYNPCCIALSCHPQILAKSSFKLP